MGVIPMVRCLPPSPRCDLYPVDQARNYIGPGFVRSWLCARVYRRDADVPSQAFYALINLAAYLLETAWILSAPLLGYGYPSRAQQGRLSSKAKSL